MGGRGGIGMGRREGVVEWESLIEEGGIGNRRMDGEGEVREGYGGREGWWKGGREEGRVDGGRDDRMEGEMELECRMDGGDKEGGREGSIESVDGVWGVWEAGRVGVREGWDWYGREG